MAAMWIVDVPEETVELPFRVSLALVKRIWKRAMKHGGHMGFMDGYGRYISIVNGEIEWGFNQQK